MERRALLLALGASALAAALAAFAQQKSAKIYRIGFLRSGRSPDAWLDAFKQSLRERGYVDGQNVSIEFRIAAGSAGWK